MEREPHRFLFSLGVKSVKERNWILSRSDFERGEIYVKLILRKERRREKEIERERLERLRRQHLTDMQMYHDYLLECERERVEKENENFIAEEEVVISVSPTMSIRKLRKGKSTFKFIPSKKIVSRTRKIFLIVNGSISQFFPKNCPPFHSFSPTIPTICFIPTLHLQQSNKISLVFSPTVVLFKSVVQTYLHHSPTASSFIFDPGILIIWSYLASRRSGCILELFALSSTSFLGCS